MPNVTFKNLNGHGIIMAATINFPAGFDESKTYPAVVVSHPGGGVKEQAAGLYAQKLSQAGLITIAFDRSFQGASTGEPRQLENPFVSTEDVSAVVDYLTTLLTSTLTVSVPWVFALVQVTAQMQPLTTVALKRWVWSAR